jgi:hypothetical protein
LQHELRFFVVICLGGSFVLNKETIETQPSPFPAPSSEKRSLEIPSAAPVRLQTLDFARHIAIAPDGKRYVVATYDETHVQRGIISAVFPQQNGYLTLVQLALCKFSSLTIEGALQRHVALVQSVQQGKLREYIKENRQ